MVLNIEVLKDNSGFPTQLNIKNNGRATKATFINNKLSITGNVTPEIIETIGLFYPVQEKPVLSLPQPLQVQNITSGGQILLFDDMEGLLKWQQVDASVALINTDAFNGLQCLQIDAVAGAIAQARRYFSIQNYNKITLSCKFNIETNANLNFLAFEFCFYSKGRIYQAYARYNPATTNWQISDTTGAYVTILTTPTGLTQRANVAGPWHHLEWTLDVYNCQHLALKNNALSWSGKQAYYQAATTGGDQCYIGIHVDANAAVDCYALIDDLMIIGESN